MTAKKQVKLWHQILFLFIPFVAIWAFYRIERLSKAVLYILIPSFILSAVIQTGLESLMEADLMAGILVSVAIDAPLFIWAIYLMRKWTLDWNTQFPENEG